MGIYVYGHVYMYMAMYIYIYIYIYYLLYFSFITGFEIFSLGFIINNETNWFRNIVIWFHYLKSVGFETVSKHHNCDT